MKLLAVFLQSPTQWLGHVNKDAAEVAFTQHSASEVAWW